MRKRARPVIGWGLGAADIRAADRIAPSATHFISQFDALITFSQTGADEYARLGFPPERILIAINAVAPAPTHPLPVRPVPAKDQPERVLFVGRLQARKQVDQLLRACAQLPELLQPDLVIVGDGRPGAPGKPG